MTIALRPGDHLLTCSNPPGGRAESPEGRRIAGAWEEVAEARSATAWTEQALGELHAVVLEALEPNWDGYGAAPVAPTAYRQARRLVRSLPSTVPPPDIGITPTGEVVLEWHAGPLWAFSIVLHRDESATYAGLYGSGRLHGTEAFVDEIPHPLLAALYRYLGSLGRG